MTTESKIKEYSRQLKNARREYDESVGKLKEIESSLKKEFGVSSVKQAEKKLEILEEEINAFQIEIDTKISELESKYDWD